MYNYISNYKGRTDLVDLYGDNSLLLYALQLRYDIEDIISVASEARHFRRDRLGLLCRAAKYRRGTRSHYDTQRRLLQFR